MPRSPRCPRTCRRPFCVWLNVSKPSAWSGLASLMSSISKTKLWEMRFGGRDGIARAIYVTAVGRRVVVVHAFVKKTQKTPRAVLDLAARRAKEIKP
jgi:phage-related protein